MVISAQTTYLREVNWDSHTATLRTAKNEKSCFICKGIIPAGSKYYSVVAWNVGLAGIKFPAKVHMEHLEDYRRLVA